MNQNLRSIIILAALGLIFGCAVSAFAQTDEPIVGGYSVSDVKDPNVIAAALYAVKTQAKKQGATIKFVSINKAETQVVAGLNFRLCLNVKIKAKGKKSYTSKLIQTVVYKNLQQKFSLTSWKEDACRPEM